MQLHPDILAVSLSEIGVKLPPETKSQDTLLGQGPCKTCTMSSLDLGMACLLSALLFVISPGCEEFLPYICTECEGCSRLAFVSLNEVWNYPNASSSNK